MAVGLHHLGHPQGATDLQEGLVLVGGVDEQGLAAPAAPHHVDVVVHRAHHHLVDLGSGVFPDLFEVSHQARIPQRRGTSILGGWSKPAGFW